MEQEGYTIDELQSRSKNWVIVGGLLLARVASIAMCKRQDHVHISFQTTPAV